MMHFLYCMHITHNCNSSSYSDQHATTRGCRCDSDCWEFGDCCLDEAAQAWEAHKRPNDSSWTCEKVPGHPDQKINYMYMLSDCPSNWTETSVKEKCNRKIFNETGYWYILDIPVVSRKTKIIYANFFCAICHEDSHIYDPTLNFHNCNITECLSLTNSGTYIPRNHYWNMAMHQNSSLNRPDHVYFSVPDLYNFTDAKHGRSCDGSLTPAHKCSSTFTDEDRQKCYQFSYFVTTNDKVMRKYKNPYCAKCHGLTFSDLQCIANTNVSLTYAPAAPKFTPPPSYAVLLDFSCLTKKKNKPNRRCGEGEAYDPLQQKCVYFYCGVGYVKKDAYCVPSDATENPVTTENGNRSTSDNDSSVSPMPENETSRIHDEECRRVLHDNFTMFPNRSILINSVSRYVFRFGEYELHNRTHVLVCVPDRYKLPRQRYSQLQQLLTVICIPLSLLGLAIHIICYLLMQRYKNLPGKNILSLSVMLFLAQLLFLFINSIPPSLGCYILAVATHFSFLSTFFWVNILAADVWRNLFAPQNWRDGVDHAKVYCRYGMYAWIVPLVIVSIAVAVDNTDILPLLRPGYGRKICWISKAAGLLIFFAVPLAIILLENIIFFAITAYGIYRNAKAVGRFRTQTLRARLCLYVKLAAIMGLTWILGFVASVVNSEPLWICFIVLNALQGTFIFIAFTLKRRVIMKLKHYITNKCKSCRTPVRTEQNSSASNQTLTTFTKSSNVSLSSPTST